MYVICLASNPPGIQPTAMPGEKNLRSFIIHRGPMKLFGPHVHHRLLLFLCESLKGFSSLFRSSVGCEFVVAFLPPRKLGGFPECQRFVGVHAFESQKKGENGEWRMPCADACFASTPESMARAKNGKGAEDV